MHTRPASSSPPASLADLSAAEMLVAYRNRQLSPVDVLAAVLQRIESWEPRLCALYAADPDAALQQARASEARWLRGEPLGCQNGDHFQTLDGVPLTLKENIATQGCPMPLGTAATLLSPAIEDAPAAARLREAGAVLLAKTTMPDYGMLSSGLSSFHALSRNPWDLSKNPGGSSAGAAAAAAAGYGPLHVGTDIGGSLRLPAGWCGIFSLKPSLGRIPIKPAYAGRVAGPMTRTVADSALMMSVLSQPDWRDATSLPAQDLDWRLADQEPAEFLRGLKLGLQMDAGWGMAVEPETAAGVQAAARLLQDAGCAGRAAAGFQHANHDRRLGQVLAHALVAGFLQAAARAPGTGSALYPSLD